MINQTETVNWTERINEWVSSRLWLVLLLLAVGIIFTAIPNLKKVDESIEYFRFKYFSKKRLMKEELRDEAEKISKYLIEFVEERRRYEPTWDFENRDESYKRYSEYSDQTKSLYYQKFYSDLDQIREEFLKYGISNNEFDVLYEHPTNYIVMEIVAKRLMEMANEL